jgi:hypothetical protein
VRFGAEILDHLDTQRKTAIVDTFTYDNDALTPCSKAAMNASQIEAAFMSLGVWSKFTWDWLLDGNLPNVIIRSGAIGTSRFLSGSIVIVDWEYGDISYFSRPGRGVLFPKSDPGLVTPVLDGSKYDLPWTSSLAIIAVPQQLHEVFARHNIRTVFTLIPFATTGTVYRERYIKKLLLSDTSGPTAPFVSIAGDQLTTFDSSHLTGDGRRIATARLLEAMSKLEVTSLY